MRKIKENNFDIDALLVLEDPVLEAKFIAGTAAYTEQLSSEPVDRRPSSIGSTGASSGGKTVC
ncbi:hypothetical protein FACS189413_14570 [Bacteroidia bacterium]|nr:hypothetical protein FACS189413_14570 [Bacteroidia bacterium]